VCLTEAVLTHSACGETLGRAGNRSRHAAPHGAFRCAPRRDDDDRWVVIAVHDDDDWRRFCRATGDAPWASDERLTTTSGRLRHVDELEASVAAWTRRRTAEDVMRLLQGAGVEAGVVSNFEDLIHDPQLVHRRHFREVDHPVVGRHLCETNAIRFSHDAEEIRRPAPCLGEHNELVYRELLGMSADEYAELAADGVFE
jgi:benzylsuccinate CoA-transferase BbsF subunit